MENLRSVLTEIIEDYGPWLIMVGLMIAATIFLVLI